MLEDFFVPFYVYFNVVWSKKNRFLIFREKNFQSWALDLCLKISFRDTGHSLQGTFSKYIGFTLIEKNDLHRAKNNFFNNAQIDSRLHQHVQGDSETQKKI